MLQPGLLAEPMLLWALWVLALLVPSAAAADRLDFNQGWQLENAGSPAVKVESLSLPASVLPALERAGLIGDPLWRWVSASQPSRGS